MVSFWHSWSSLSCLGWRWEAPLEKALAHRSASPAASALFDPQPTRLRGWQEPWAGRLQPSHSLQGRATRSCFMHRPLSSAPQCAAKRRQVEAPAECQEGGKPRGSSVAAGRSSRPWRSRRPRACPAGITPLPSPSRN